MAPAIAADAYLPENPAQIAARRNANDFVISKYEHLEELIPWHEEAGSAPISLDELRKRRANDWTDALRHQPRLGAAQSRLSLAKQPIHKVWLTKRRRDGKLFLAQEFKDKDEIADETKETLLRLLNHPNLVSLADLRRDSLISEKSKDYTVWDYCDKGTLNRLLWHAPGQEQIEIPESLCWHVLDGINQALLWLHYGHKDTFPFDRHMGHDDDWHPVLMTDINPANIYFCSPEEDETYGLVKLGNFGTATICSSVATAEVITPIFYGGKYQPPEIRNNTHGWDMKSDIWSLGAVLYHMMVGAPPVDTERNSPVPETPSMYNHWVKAFPKRYSKGLCNIVREMLHFTKEKRPSAADLSPRVGAGFRIWRETADEGKDYVGRGENRRRGMPLF
ncbi:MAG: hypothetical protein M1835_005977 [Candelina submexicana]|nr:MAG: hypothetical protein M1835_005977 [Candelina submexicana]